MKLLKGSSLTPNQKQQVLNAYVHRYTGNHFPSWANKTMPNGDTYKPLFASDDEWLNSYSFYFKNDGTLASKPSHCVPNSLVFDTGSI